MIVEEKSLKIGWGIKQFRFKCHCFKTPKFQVHNVSHENLGNFVCLVYIEKQTQTHVFRLKERKDGQPLYIFRDHFNEYAIYYNFQILGQIVEKRMKKLNECRSEPYDWSYIHLQSLFAEYKKKYRENQFSLLTGSELQSVLFWYFKKNSDYENYTGFSDFNINLFAKRCNFIFMYGHFPVKSNQRQLLTTRKTNLLNVAKKIFQNLDSSLEVLLNQQGQITCNRTDQQIMKLLKAKIEQKSKLKLLAIENFDLWLTPKIAFMLYKVLMAKHENDAFLRNYFWRIFFAKFDDFSEEDDFSNHQRIIKQKVSHDILPQNKYYNIYRRKCFVKAHHHPRYFGQTAEMEEEERRCNFTEHYTQEFIKFHKLMGIKYLKSGNF